jgi:hypothetical protein
MSHPAEIRRQVDTAQAIAGAVEAERRAKQAETQAAIAEAKKAETEPKLLSDPMRQKIASQPTPSKDEAKAATKTAEIFEPDRMAMEPGWQRHVPAPMAGRMG